MSDEKKPLPTLQELVHSDPRFIKLKEEYQVLEQSKHGYILQLSQLESDLIGAMAVYTYLGNFNEAEEEKTKLLAKIMALIVKKDEIIKTVISVEQAMQNKAKSAEPLAELIVDELKEAAGMNRGLQSGPCGDQCPETGCSCKETPTEAGKDITVTAPNLTMGADNPNPGS